MENKNNNKKQTGQTKLGSHLNLAGRLAVILGEITT